jgi:hypothetical protein
MRGRLVGLVAGSPKTAAQPVVLGVEHRLDRIVDAAEIWGFDLRIIRRPGVGKCFDVIEGVAPLIDNDLDFVSAPRARRAQSPEGIDLRLPGTGDDEALEQQLVRLHRRLELAEIVGNGIDILAEQFPERAVDVEMNLRTVTRFTDLTDAPDDPTRISD